MRLNLALQCTEEFLLPVCWCVSLTQRVLLDTMLSRKQHVSK